MTNIYIYRHIYVNIFNQQYKINIKIMASIVYNDRPKVTKKNNNNVQQIKTVLRGYANEILPNLYLGSKESCNNLEMLGELNKLNIKAIVNCTKSKGVFEKNNNITYCNIRINDESGADIGTYFPDSTEFIHTIIMNGGSVLAHCQQGISRSSTIIIAYLMRYYKMKRDEAYLKVKILRPVIDPNIGFYQQLAVFEYFLFSDEQDETLSSFVKKSIDNNNIMEEQEEEDIVDLKKWPRISSAKFGMLQSSIKDFNHFFQDIFKLLPKNNDKNENINNVDEMINKIFDAALDYIFGRGFDTTDLLWLKYLFETLCNYNNDYYKKIVRNVVKGQLSEGSTLLINWEGEYRPRHMKALFDILSLHE